MGTCENHIRYISVASVEASVGFKGDSLMMQCHSGVFICVDGFILYTLVIGALCVNIDISDNSRNFCVESGCSSLKCARSELINSHLVLALIFGRMISKILTACHLDSLIWLGLLNTCYFFYKKS